MENRVCDLEQMEERDPADRGRRIGTVLMATLGIVGLTFAMGVVVGKAAEPNPGAKKDPLDQLDRVAAATAVPATAGQPKGAAQPSLAVEANDLTFPKSLTDEEDRPEVIAALQAAAREEAALSEQGKALPEAAGKPLAAAAPTRRTEEPTLTAKPAADEDADQAAPRAAAAPEAAPKAPTPAPLPAAVAAGSSGRKLEKQAKHDQLVAAALPTDRAEERAPHGEEGEYTLQVISYDAPAPAQAFASSLRAKGHEAFVTTADVPERGRYYRVRIGPFANKERADAYRHKFEEQEHMNIIVVKRQKGDDDR
ncbi:MAG TPA: SPOR domain-containing protein [Polyangiales bacterium]